MAIPRGRGRIPIGLLGMSALIALVEMAIASRQPAFVNAWACDWRQSASAASFGAEVRNAGILCVGDSLAKFGIVPMVLEARLGLKAYNLAVSAGTPPASFYLLRRALEAGARPRAVLFECSPHALAMPIPCSRVLMPELARINEAIDLGIMSRDPELLGCLLTAKLLNSIKDRLELRAWAWSCLTDGKDDVRSRRLIRAVFERNRQVNHGGEFQRHRPRPRGGGWDELRPVFAPDSWSMTAEMHSYITRLFELTAAEGVPVYWVLPPLCPELHALRERKGLEAQLAGTIAEFQGRFPHVTVLDARCSGYDDDVFVDAIHLDSQGAAALSHQVADVLESSLKPTRKGPAWVALPAYQQRELPAAIEDMDASREALRLAWQDRHSRH